MNKLFEIHRRLHGSQAWDSLMLSSGEPFQPITLSAARLAAAIDAQITQVDRGVPTIDDLSLVGEPLRIHRRSQA
jgi:hypothetical protein